MPRLLAPSISNTSTSSPRAIVSQASHRLQGVVVGPLAQFRALARIRAVDVLPTPLAPVNKYAWPTRLVVIALLKAWATWPWPTKSAKDCGRYRRATTTYSPVDDDGVTESVMMINHQGNKGGRAI